MRRSSIVLFLCCSGGFLFPTPSAVAAPVSPNSGTLVVNTLFDATRESPVLEATGVFSGCTTVSQLDTANKFLSGTEVYSGYKQINCAGGTLVVAYTATLDKDLPGARGYWRPVEGTGVYVGVSGGGRLTGDGNQCNPMGTPGCVLDTFAGNLT